LSILPIEELVGFTRYCSYTKRYVQAEKPMTNTIINIFFYSGFVLQILLGVKFIYELIRSKKDKYFETLRLFLSFGIILTFCYGAFLSLALIVRPPSEITESKEQSLENLNQWVINEELKIGLIGLCIITLLGIFNYLYQRRIEKLNLIKPIIRLTIINCLIVIISLALIYTHTYNGLAVKVGYHFK
jgi:amino acid transporter